MTIGSLLLQPQAVKRFKEFDYKQSLGDDIAAVATQLIMHPEWLELVANEAEANLESFITDIVAQLETRLDRGRQALEQTIEPFVNSINELFDDTSSIETVGDVLNLLLAIVDKLAALIESLSIENIRQFIDKLINILVNKFGFSVAYLQQLLCQFFDKLIETFEQDISGQSQDYMDFRLALARLLKRIKREFLANLPNYELSSEPIAQQIIKGLRNIGLDVFKEKASCLAEKIRAVLGAGTSIYDLAKTTGLGPSSVGAVEIDPIRTGKKYCWYASWLYQTRRRGGFWDEYLVPMVPKDEVWISEDGKKLILRRVLEDKDEVLYESNSEINWYDAPQFSQTTGDEYFTFTSTLSPQFMEEWTKVVSVFVYFAKTVGHLIGISEPGNHVTHSLLAGWNLTRVIGTAATEAPFSSWLRDKIGLGMGHRSWMDIFFQWFSVIFGSIEGRHSATNAGNEFLVWFTLLGDDALDAFLIHLWPTMVHEGFLSIFTLINYRGTGYTNFDDDNKPKNHEYVYPLVNASMVLYTFILNRAVIPREDYSHPFDPDNAGDYHLWYWTLSPTFGAMAGITGELIGWALSRSVSPRRLLIQMALGAWKGWGTHILANYFWKEGETDDGKYNPGSNTAFNGYQPANTSPYRLPVAGGENIFVGQANQGMFSHFYDPAYTLSQVYAIDFSHDFQQMIVAARDGTVVDYFDWIADDINPDATQTTTADTAAQTSGLLVAGQTGNPGNSVGNNGGWNFILIRHDDPHNTETTDEKGHDLDQGGAAVTTYGVYGHGANGGVRAAFAGQSPTIAANNIIGTKVTRGTPIMQAGDTGISFHNHLHMHVQPGPAAPTPVPATTTPVNQGALTNRTLPFVFRDASHPLKPNGRLFHLTWYKSGNT